MIFLAKINYFIPLLLIFSKLIRPKFQKDEEILSNQELNELFLAKCRDLNVDNDELLKNKFLLYCKKNCSNRKFNFSNVYLEDGNQRTYN